MRFSYDPDADAAFLYLVDEVAFGEAKRSRFVPIKMKGASIMVVLDENDRALGVEFLGARTQLTPALIAGIVESGSDLAEPAAE